MLPVSQLWGGKREKMRGRWKERERKREGEKEGERERERINMSMQRKGRQRLRERKITYFVAVYSVIRFTVALLCFILMPDPAPNVPSKKIIVSIIAQYHCIKII